MKKIFNSLVILILTTGSIAAQNVGVGVSNPAYKLDISGALRIQGDTVRGSAGPASNFNFLSNGGFHFDLDFNNDGSEKFIIRSLISGVPTPLFDVDENGNAKIYDVTGTGGKLTVDDLAGSAGALIDVDGSGLLRLKPLSGISTDVLTGDGNFTSIDALNDVDWYQVLSTNRPTNINDWMYTNGNIGINFGSAVNPYASLHVQSNIYAGDANGVGFFNGNAILHLARTDNPHLVLEDISQNTAGLAVNSTGMHLTTEAGDIDLRTGITATGDFSTTGTSRLYIENAGDVGIGTTAPDRKLDVVGNIRASSTLEALANNTWYLRGGDDHELRDINQANFMGLWGITNPDQGGIQLGSDGSYLYGDNGNIGVGTTAPGAKLEVAGQVKITGGAPGSGKVLTSDGSGLATWQDPSRNISVASNMVYSFDDVAWTVGTSGDDAISGGVAVGFDVKIFGNTYNTCYLGTNGYIKFGDGGYMSFANNCLPSGTIAGSALLFWWDDLICNSFQYRTVGTSPNRVFQARYDGYQFSNTGEIVDVMISIHEGSNLFVVRYDDVGCCGDDAKGGGATFGLQGAGGGIAPAVPIGCNTPIADDNQGPSASQFWSVSAPD